jgi:hypothetical protein
MLIRGSSSTMVPIPWPSPTIALTGSMRFTENVSAGSASRSPITGTLIVLLVSPAAKVTKPDAAW